MHPAGGPAQAVGDGLPRPAGRRGRVRPPLPEHRRYVLHGRPQQTQLDVVPGRRRAVDVAERLGLPVPRVRGVVAAGAGGIDAPDERHVAGRAADDDELLVVATQQPHPLVEHDLTTRRGHRAGQVAVLSQAVAERRGV